MASNIEKSSDTISDTSNKQSDIFIFNSENDSEFIQPNLIITPGLTQNEVDKINLFKLQQDNEIQLWNDLFDDSKSNDKKSAKIYPELKISITNTNNNMISKKNKRTIKTPMAPTNAKKNLNVNFPDMG